MTKTMKLSTAVLFSTLLATPLAAATVTRSDVCGLVITDSGKLVHGCLADVTD